MLLLLGTLGSEPQPKGGQWWLLFFFLIPFVAIGLLLIFTVLNSFLEIFRTTTWTFSYDMATFRTARLGLGQTENYDLSDWNSLAVHIFENEENDSDTQRFFVDDDMQQIFEECAFWQLAFLNAAGETLVSIDELYKSEALWMADIVLRERRSIR